MSKPKDSLQKKARALLRAKDKGKEWYAKSDALLDELLAAAPVGTEIPLGGGKKAVVVDNFALKNKAWKVAGINRIDVKVVADAA
jgi:hypothetical protein